MNLDDVMAAWRAQDLSPLYGVDQSLLHQLVRQEQAKLEKQRRRLRRILYVTNAVLLLTAALFFTILIDPNQPQTFSARVVIWDYVVGGVGVAAAVILAGALFAHRRSLEALDRGFGDSLRDHLRRRITQIDAEVTYERRLGLIIVATIWVCAKAISILGGRIMHVPVPWGELLWPSPVKTVLILGFVYLMFFRWLPRGRQQSLQRRRQLEALLKQFESQ
jgi:hypothetical protein